MFWRQDTTSNPPNKAITHTLYLTPRSEVHEMMMVCQLVKKSATIYGTHSPLTEHNSPLKEHTAHWRNPQPINGKPQPTTAFAAPRYCKAMYDRWTQLTRSHIFCVTCCVRPSPSREADGRSASQSVPCLLRNPQFHYLVLYIFLPQIPILTHS